MKVLLPKKEEGAGERVICDGCQAVLEIEDFEEVVLVNVSVLPMIGKERDEPHAKCPECGNLVIVGRA